MVLNVGKSSNEMIESASALPVDAPVMEDLTNEVPHKYRDYISPEVGAREATDAIRETLEQIQKAMIEVNDKATELQVDLAKVSNDVDSVYGVISAYNGLETKVDAIKGSISSVNDDLMKKIYTAYAIGGISLLISILALIFR